MDDKKIFEIDLYKIKRYSIIFGLFFLVFNLALFYSDAIKPYGIYLLPFFSHPIFHLITITAAAKKGELNLILSSSGITGPKDNHYTKTSLPLKEIDISTLNTNVGLYERLTFTKKIKNVYGDSHINISTIGFDREQLSTIIDSIKIAINNLKNDSEK